MAKNGFLVTHQIPQKPHNQTLLSLTGNGNSRHLLNMVSFGNYQVGPDV